jgi:acetyl-CoA acyltransferase
MSVSFMQSAYIVAIQRSPVTKANKGAFKDLRPDDLLAMVIQATLKQLPSLDPVLIEDLIVGCAMPEGAQGMNIARIAGLLAGLPDSVPGVTINRFCSSGLQSIAFAAERIMLGQADVLLAGGVESMSMVPMTGFHLSMNPKIFTDPKLLGISYSMGVTGEEVAEKYKVSRLAQDEYSLRSHQKALAAQAQGWFAQEIIPIQVTTSSPDLATQKVEVKTLQVLQDEGPRVDTSLAALEKLPAVFKKEGTVTAGNSSQMSDGAAICVLMSERMVNSLNIKPMARFCGFAVAGVPPEIMGIGPVVAIPKVLKATGLALTQLDWIELNEAFAAQTLAVIETLGLDVHKVNPQGGAIALGHPLGATGTIRAATLLHGLQRIKGRYGLCTMCVGTGMGAAGIFELL